MKIKILIFMTAVVLVVLSFFAFDHSPMSLPNGPVEQLSDNDQVHAEESTPTSDAQPNSEQVLNIDLSEQYAETYLKYQSLFEKRDEFQTFFAQAENLEQAERDAKIEQLQQSLVELKSENKISLVEALMLQLALLKYSGDHEQAKQQGQQLVDAYQQYVEQRKQYDLEHPEPKFKAYKEKEKLIVEEVMSMLTFPDGLTREEYLARRLSEARNQAYSIEETL